MCSSYVVLLFCIIKLDRLSQVLSISTDLRKVPQLHHQLSTNNRDYRSYTYGIYIEAVI